MENANLMLLCNTSQSEVKGQELQVQEAESLFVKVKVEAGETGEGGESVVCEPGTAAGGGDSWNTNSETDTNNNRIICDEDSFIQNVATGQIHTLKSTPEADDLPLPEDTSPSPTASEQVVEAGVQETSTSSPGQQLSNTPTGDVSSCSSDTANNSTAPSVQITDSDQLTTVPDISGNSNSSNSIIDNDVLRQVQTIDTASTPNQPLAPACEISARKDLSAQFYLPEQSQGMEQRNLPMYMPVEGTFAYESMPGMDTLADTAVLQMSRMQQQAFEQAQMDISQQTLARACNWSNTAVNSQYGFPVASSTPDVDGRRFVFPTSDAQQLQSDASLIQAYQALQTEQEQINWMANHIAGLPAAQQAGILYEESAASDRAWNMHQTLPLDMTPGSGQGKAGVQENQMQNQFAGAGAQMMQERARRTNKRTHSGNMGDGAGPAAKVAKESAGENYQISTNVHTLKPRHMIAWYIDHLIQENENITQISKSFTVPVNILNSKDMYFMDSVLKRTNFPSRKFLEWMQSNFPNINIHAVDFSEGRQPYFYIPYEEQLRGKDRNEIINDLFFYFQHRSQK